MELYGTSLLHQQLQHSISVLGWAGLVSSLWKED